MGECLYRNGNKIYSALLKVGGKQIKRSLKTSDLALAKRRLAELREKAKRQTDKGNRNIRFEELAEMWLASIKPDLKAASYARRCVAIAGLKTRLAGKNARAIGYADIDEWKRKRGATLSARSHNIELETLKIVLRYACERGILLENAAEKFKRKRQAASVVQIPTRQEFLALVRALRESPKAVASGTADMVEFLAYSGMRVGEAREILVQDINFERGTILITGGEIGTKNHHERTIPLFPSLRSLLERMKGNGKVGSPSQKLFSILSPRNAMEPACKRSGLKRFTVHSLRHFFASNAIESGINYKTIAEWLGHSDGGILVAKTYGHLREEFSAQMAKFMTFEANSAMLETTELTSSLIEAV